MINLSNSQKIYISVLAIGVVLLIIGTCFFIYKKFYHKKHFREVTYLKLYKLARLNDYLLLNNYRVEFDDNHFGVIDHILISKKYIFVINDFNLSGVISGEMKDLQLRVITSNKEVKKVANPLNYNINLIKRVNIYNKLDQSLIKGLVVINDDSHIDIEGNTNQFNMVRRKDMTKIIKKFESDDVKNLREEDVVRFINKLNKENTKNNG